MSVPYLIEFSWKIAQNNLIRSMIANDDTYHDTLND